LQHFPAAPNHIHFDFQQSRIFLFLNIISKPKKMIPKKKRQKVITELFIISDDDFTRTPTKLHKTETKRIMMTSINSPSLLNTIFYASLIPQKTSNIYILSLIILSDKLCSIIHFWGF